MAPWLSVDQTDSVLSVAMLVKRRISKDQTQQNTEKKALPNVRL